MQNSIRWSKGLQIEVVPSNSSSDKSEILRYKERNLLEDKVNKNIYFNESLFPTAFEGLVIYIDNNSNHIMQSYEIIKVF